VAANTLEMFRLLIVASSRVGLWLIVEAMKRYNEGAIAVTPWQRSEGLWRIVEACERPGEFAGIPSQRSSTTLGRLNDIVQDMRERSIANKAWRFSAALIAAMSLVRLRVCSLD
jgi:hypothetical protein